VASDAIKVAEIVFKLGVAVYEAIQKGDRTRTVGEIFDGVRKDMDEIERLEAEVAARKGWSA
jgi:hypothetical protein